MISDMLKNMISKRETQMEIGSEQSLADLIGQCISFKEASSCQGPFNRMNEPLLLIPTSDIQRYLEYENIKYNTKRDSTDYEML